MSANHSQEPSIGRLRRRARSLIRQHQAHDPVVANVLRTHHPAFANLSTDDILSKTLHLADAQLALARQHGQSNWRQINSIADLLRGAPTGSGIPVDESRIAEPEYRKELAARKGLAPIGTRKVSDHGVAYMVDDHAIVMSDARIAHGPSSESVAHIDELLPVIEFTNMSPRLKGLLAEVDRCTSKDLIFFDTMPDNFPGDDAPNFHRVRTTGDPRHLTFHFDASRVHETIIGHELGHLWIEFVDGCEDYRCLRDYSDLAKAMQFQLIQSFVLDLKVNDLLETRGFDMSVIAAHQLEAIRGFAKGCAKGEQIKTKRAAVAMSLVIAEAVLERRRWPTSQIQDIETCLAVIRAKQTELFRLAELFIASVERHGYLDRAAICRVVDDCATLSFAATRDDFNLDRDLVEAPPTEWMQDKNPNFLPGLPVAVKLDVWRAAARHGLGSHVKWGLGVSMPDRVYVQLIDGAGEDRKEVFISLNVPTGQIDTSRLQPAAAPASYAADRMQAHWQRPPWQQALLPLPAFPHSRVPDGVPLPSVVQLAAPSVPMVTAFPWQVAGAKPGKHGFSTGRHYLPGVGVWISRVGFEEQWEGEHPYGYVENNPITNTDPTGESNKPTAPTCTTGTPVYVTCYSGTSSKDTAVYCQPANICGTCSRKDKKHKGKKHKYGPNCESFCKHCVSAPSTLGTPVFSRGTPICIVNADGTAPPFMSERTINDCGCGQGDANKPDPDNWIDVSDSGCSDGWYCASVKTAGKKCC